MGAPMNWNGNDLDTIGELSNAVLEIARADDQDAADRFMAQYRAETEHADANVGYLSGYYDRDTMVKVQRMFGAAHPIFGSSVPTPDEAFAMGQEWAARS